MKLLVNKLQGRHFVSQALVLTSQVIAIGSTHQVACYEQQQWSEVIKLHDIAQVKDMTNELEDDTIPPDEKGLIFLHTERDSSHRGRKYCLQVVGSVVSRSSSEVW